MMMVEKSAPKHGAARTRSRERREVYTYLTPPRLTIISLCSQWRRRGNIITTPPQATKQTHQADAMILHSDFN
jgi:hypothetical protein